MAQAVAVTPTLAQHPSLVPLSVMRLTSPHMLDWTCPSFLQLFQQMLSCIY